MTRVELNEIYEESVFQIRLRVATQLLSVPGITPSQALAEADRFVLELLKEEDHQLLEKFR